VKIILPGEFTSLNEYISAERTNRFMAAKIKREETDRVVWECRIQEIDLTDTASYFIFHWYVKNKKKDPDNIAFSRKFLMDGLVKAGVIVNDTQEYVKGFVDLFTVDASNPRVEVTTITSLSRLMTKI